MSSRNGRLRGFTLVELLTVLVLGSALMLVSVGMLHTAMKHRTEATQCSNQNVRIDRFCHQFRQDVHSHSTATLQGGTLILGDRQVVYEIDDGQVMRRTDSDETKEHVEHVERLGLACNCQWGINELKGRQQVEMQISIPSAQRRISRTVVAVSGRMPIAFDTATFDFSRIGSESDDRN